MASFFNKEKCAAVSTVQVFHELPLKIKQQNFASENYADCGDKIICFLMKVADVKGKKKCFLNYICSESLKYYFY